MTDSLAAYYRCLIALSCVIASQVTLGCTSKAGDHSVGSAGLVILRSGDKIDLSDGVTMHVNVSNYVGGEANILWINTTNDRVMIDIEAPLGVSERMKAIAGRTKPTECVRREEEDVLDGAFAAGWNISHVTVAGKSWNHSYIAGLIHEDRGCLVALRVSASSDPTQKYDILIDGSTTANVAAGSNDVVTREIQTNLHVESIAGAASEDYGVRIDVLVRNNSQSNVFATSHLNDLNCASDLTFADPSSRDWLAELTKNGTPRQVSQRSWAVLSFVLVGADSRPGELGCGAQVSVTVVDERQRRVWAETVPFTF